MYVLLDKTVTSLFAQSSVQGRKKYYLSTYLAVIAGTFYVELTVIAKSK